MKNDKIKDRASLAIINTGPTDGNLFCADASYGFHHVVPLAVVPACCGRSRCSGVAVQVGSADFGRKS